MAGLAASTASKPASASSFQIERNVWLVVDVVVGAVLIAVGTAVVVEDGVVVMVVEDGVVAMVAGASTVNGHS